MPDYAPLLSFLSEQAPADAAASIESLTAVGLPTSVEPRPDAAPGPLPTPKPEELTPANSRALAELTLRSLNAAITRFEGVRDKATGRYRISRRIRFGIAVLTTVLSSGVVATLNAHPTVALGCGVGALISSIGILLADYLAVDGQELVRVATEIENARFLSGRLELYVSGKLSEIDVDSAIEQCKQFVALLAAFATKYDG
jgi:hypothetical protein